MANQRRSFRGTAPKRGMFWQGFTAQDFAVTAATSRFAIAVDETQLEGVPNPTLIRQRGVGLVYLNAGAVGLDSLLGLGMYVVNAQALAGGTASMQRPITDIGSDWLWHQFAFLSDDSGTLDQARPNKMVYRFEIDGKAMRKIDANQALVVVMQVQDAGLASNVNVNLAMRLLFKK